jgi:flavin reductase (DIM6/NTAB) family NADH-FMN oxidoreductase RutF
MDIREDELTAEAAYKLLVGCVVPRPIAWITTISTSGIVNAAPFSAFTFLSNKPPLVGVSIGRKAGKLKDTANNILGAREFVVNIGNETLLEPIHESAHEYESDVSEPAELGIELDNSITVTTPRIAAAPINLECCLEQILEFGDFRTCFIVGRVQLFHIRDDLIQQGKIDSIALRPLARLGGPHYARIGEVVTMRTLKVTPK